MLHDLKTVTLHTVYVFDCEECGTENLVRPIAAEIPEDEKQEMIEAGQFEDAHGEWVTIPQTVICRNCHAKFATIDASQDI